MNIRSTSIADQLEGLRPGSEMFPSIRRSWKNPWKEEVGRNSYPMIREGGQS